MALLHLFKNCKYFVSVPGQGFSFLLSSLLSKRGRCDPQVLRELCQPVELEWVKKYEMHVPVKLVHGVKQGTEDLFILIYINLQ